MNENENKNVKTPDEESALADAKKIALAAAKVLDGKKARDIKILCINEKTIIADYFVIAMGTSTTQVNSLAGEVEYKLGEELGISPSRTEGEGSGTWGLLDYNRVIDHVVGRDAREFYKLDKLWADAEQVPFESLPEE